MVHIPKTPSVSTREDMLARLFCGPEVELLWRLDLASLKALRACSRSLRDVVDTLIGVGPQARFRKLGRMAKPSKALLCCMLEGVDMLSLASCHLPNLRLLDISDSDLGLEGLHALASMDLPLLRVLVLRDCTELCLWDGVAALVAGRWPELEELDLGWDGNCCWWLDTEDWLTVHKLFCGDKRLCICIPCTTVVA